MFERRSPVTAYTQEQTLRWLAWLAGSLRDNNLSVFYVEWMQPDWLPSRGQRRIIAIVPMIVVGLFVGLVVGLVFALYFGLVVGLLAGPFVGLFSALFSGLPFRPRVEGDRITPVEALRWSWKWAAIGWVGGLLAGLSFALFVGLVVGLLAGPFVGLLFALYVGLLFGLTTDQIVTRTSPNEGIQRSLQNALIIFITVGLFVGSAAGLLDKLQSGLTYGLVSGLSAGLTNGGVACFKHYVLRFLLWRNDYAPLNYIRFLDHAAERVFLRKVGGGYIFTHRLLMEYFAALQPTDQARQTKTT